MKFEKRALIGVIFALVIIILDVILFRKDKFFYFILVFSGIIASFPFVLGFILDRGKQKELEAKFL